jgi:hypothetical protein
VPLFGSLSKITKHLAKHYFGKTGPSIKRFSIRNVEGGGELFGRSSNAQSGVKFLPELSIELHSLEK